MTNKISKMKKTFLFLVAIYSTAAIAQTASPDVIATSGTSFNDGTSQIDWTIGETVTATLTSGGNTLSEGFHQPNLMYTAINNAETDYSVILFPNPTLDYLQLKFQNLKREVMVEVFSGEGKLLLNQKTSSAGDMLLDMSNYAAGTYLLSIKDSDSKIKTYQVIKLK